MLLFSQSLEFFYFQSLLDKHHQYLYLIIFFLSLSENLLNQFIFFEFIYVKTIILVVLMYR